MAKKHKPEGEKKQDKTAAGYYELHTEAVNDLVTADVSNSPRVSEAELRKYRSGPGFKIPVWVRILFIKFWFAAAVCYFFIWGLSTHVSALVDTMFITGMALGIATDLLTNNVIRFFASVKGEHDRWMMFPKNGYITFPLNIIYAYLLLYIVFVIYNIINMVIISFTGEADTVPLGVEPVLFGLFYLGADMLLIEIKHFIFNIIKDAKDKAKAG